MVIRSGNWRRRGSIETITVLEGNGEAWLQGNEAAEHRGHLVPGGGIRGTNVRG